MHGHFIAQSYRFMRLKWQVAKVTKWIFDMCACYSTTAVLYVCSHVITSARYVIGWMHKLGPRRRMRSSRLKGDCWWLAGKNGGKYRLMFFWSRPSWWCCLSAGYCRSVRDYRCIKTSVIDRLKKSDSLYLAFVVCCFSTDQQLVPVSWQADRREKTGEFENKLLHVVQLVCSAMDRDKGKRGASFVSAIYWCL